MFPTTNKTRSYPTKRRGNDESSFDSAWWHCLRPLSQNLRVRPTFRPALGDWLTCVKRLKLMKTSLASTLNVFQTKDYSLCGRLQRRGGFMGRSFCVLSLLMIVVLFGSLAGFGGISTRTPTTVPPSQAVAPAITS